jgi:hypothetical protein
MKCVRKTTKYTPFGPKRGQDILKELQTRPVLVEFNKCNRTDRARLPLLQTVVKYQPAGMGCGTVH